MMAWSIRIHESSFLLRYGPVEFELRRNNPRRRNGFRRGNKLSSVGWRKLVVAKGEFDPSASGLPVVGGSGALEATIFGEEVDGPIGENADIVKEDGFRAVLDDGDDGDDGGDEGGRKFPSGGGGDDESKDDKETQEFGPLLKLEEVLQEVKKRGISLPSDMLESAKDEGIRRTILQNYMQLQGAAWPIGNAIRSISLFRNRMLVDRSFLFKIGTEIVIDSCCATFAEVQKRGKEFWSEFELYMADLLVGGVVTVALVGMLAPYARFGRPSTSNGLFGRMARICGALPSSVFEAERPGCRFSLGQRVATYFYKGVLYGSVGFACGIVGQGIANLIMTAKRTVKKSEEDVPVPPLLKSAALWGVFLGVSSNTRYQIINGLEQVVEASPVARRMPVVAMAFTVGVRFANNVYGGMQFVDWARWSGCQ